MVPKDTASGRLASMTGFARASGADGDCSWTVEIKAVNGRSLDVRTRMPQGLDAIEALARTEVAQRFKRGNLNINVSLTQNRTESRLRVNRELLKEVLLLAHEVEAAGAGPQRLDAILSVRGVIESSDDAAEIEERQEHIEKGVLDTLKQALDALASARLAEGAYLHAVLEEHMAEIERLIVAASEQATTQPAAIAERLRTQISSLLDGSSALSEDRLAQEIAILVTKSDVREELDRLKAHIASARELLAEGTNVGRRLDFLCQEFNREANTLCSKSSSVELTRIGLALKAVVEQFREQVQNIE